MQYCIVVYELPNYFFVGSLLSIWSSLVGTYKNLGFGS